MKPQWTADQQKVIDLRDSNILVSAAAGSGKTAVLVERIIGRITDRQTPVDIDRLLVVTFTKAAAAEMRGRIGEALQQKLEQTPDDDNLQRQIGLLHNAQITTIDSFCQHIIRNYFHVIDLDPMFQVGDETDLKIMKEAVLGEVLEQKYADARQKENQVFLDAMQMFATGRTDKEIESIVLKLYELAQSYPFPDEQLEQWKNSYALRSVEEMEQTEWMKKYIADVQMIVAECEKKAFAAYQISVDGVGLEAYTPTIQTEWQQIKELRECKTLQELCDGIGKISFGRLSAIRGNKHDKELQEQIKALRASYRDKGIEQLQKEMLAEPPEEMLAMMQQMDAPVRELVQLTIDFGKAFAEKKREDGIIDFADMEHFALQILVTRDEDGNSVPSATAKELQEYYEEIMTDEYQDSNYVQEMILTSISRGPEQSPYLFMVGDVKQSIYRFRLADAAIFMDKYHRYADASEDEHMQRIDLSRNFRSRESVLSGINYIFRRIMKKSLGGIDYDEHAALYPGMEYPEAPGKNIAGSAEVLFLTADSEEADPEEEVDTVSLEAKLAAARIRELTDSEHGLDIYDSDLGIYRKAGYKDIVILLRTVTGWAEKFVDILTAENIPACAEMSAGFFDTIEIQTMLQFLSVVDNPKQDIPLAAVLCSPIVGMTSEELAMVRSANQEEHLFEACTGCGRELAGYDKIRKFLTLLTDIRRASVYMELYELIRYIYDQTGYYDYVQALPGGERRKANLDLLQERAVTYASGSYSGLFDFMRYIEQLKKNQIDFGEAAMPEGDKGRVQIMSIHKSKGLEYPIVILSGLGKKFNFKDSISKMILHSEAGIGIDAVNLQSRKKMASAYKKYLSSRLNLETLAEEQRILYVAMTRAKEKLVMTGADGSKKIEEKLDDWRRRGESADAAFPDWMLTSAKSYLDWIMPAVLRKDAENDFIVRMVDIRELAGREVGRTIEKRWQKEELLERSVSQDQESAMAKALERDVKWQYAQLELLSVKGKYSVSELKKYAMEEIQEAEELTDLEKNSEIPEGDEELPDFMKDVDESEMQPGDNIGAFRGTAYHRVLELLDFAGCPDERDEKWLRAQLSAMEKSGRLAAEQRKSISVKNLADMVFSDLGRRMTQADRRHQLYREAQFVMGVPVSVVRSEIAGEETVLIQGIIDAYFEENDAVILLDYKTDRVPIRNGAEILQKRYQRQLDDYQYALEQILQKKVRQKLIYSFALKTWIDF